MANTNAKNTNAKNTNNSRNAKNSNAGNLTRVPPNVANALPTSPADADVKRMPLSGSETTYTNITYGTKRGIGNNNCYGWALDVYKNSGTRKLQPGNLAHARGTMDLASCGALTSRTLQDLRRRTGGRAHAVDADSPCAKGFYKIMGFLAPGRDYHWYRQHKDVMVRLTDKAATPGAVAASLGVEPSQVYSPTRRPRVGDMVLVKNSGLWSHKQGFATGPLLKDACGKAIRDPRRACRTYTPELDYTQFCGAFCVPAAASVAAAAAARTVAARVNARASTGRPARPTARPTGRSTRRRSSR